MWLHFFFSPRTWRGLRYPFKLARFVPLHVDSLFCTVRASSGSIDEYMDLYETALTLIFQLSARTVELQEQAGAMTMAKGEPHPRS
jgi:hypothetical protein